MADLHQYGADVVAAARHTPQQRLEVVDVEGADGESVVPGPGEERSGLRPAPASQCRSDDHGPTVAPSPTPHIPQAWYRTAIIRHRPRAASTPPVILVAVFATWTTVVAASLKELGFGLAIAVLLDATIVRGVLLPAAMILLGEKNWYLPRW